MSPLHDLMAGAYGPNMFEYDVQDGAAGVDTLDNANGDGGSEDEADVRIESNLRELGRQELSEYRAQVSRMRASEVRANGGLRCDMCVSCEFASPKMRSGIC